MRSIRDVEKCPRCGQHFLLEGDETRWDPEAVVLQISIDKKVINVNCRMCEYVTKAEPLGG